MDRQNAGFREPGSLDLIADPPHVDHIVRGIGRTDSLTSRAIPLESARRTIRRRTLPTLAALGIGNMSVRWNAAGVPLR